LNFVFTNCILSVQLYKHTAEHVEVSLHRVALFKPMGHTCVYSTIGPTNGNL